jgi:ABC-2 type transport system ATP-binding protein
MSPAELAIRAEQLRKTFGETTALDGLDLEVPAGMVYGLLGPNGAGKTTAVRIFATLTRPDGGHAEVAGFDVTRRSDEVRYRIGLSGQFAAIDDALTGRQNLEMFGRLFHLDAASARRRAGELLEQFALTEAAGCHPGYVVGLASSFDQTLLDLSSPSWPSRDEHERSRPGRPPGTRESDVGVSVRAW